MSAEKKTAVDATASAEVVPDLVEIPVGTDEFLWKVAAAYFDVSIAELLADTAAVTATHYEAAKRVERVFDREWDRIDAEAAAAAGESPQPSGDAFARLMLVAEELAGFANSRRDSGDAAMAATYARLQANVLEVAAGLQDIQGAVSFRGVLGGARA